jgi:acetyl esterase/lipase
VAPLHPGAERFLRMLAASRQGSGPPRSVAERRRMLAGLAERAGEGPAAAVEARDLMLPGPGGPIGARLYARPHAAAAGLVYLHGGGWVAGGLDTHDALCRRLAASSGVKLLAVDYRLAPEHPFPAALEDALAALRWTADHAAELGLDGRRLAIGGDSVGGGLAAVVAQDPAAPALALQLLLCPILDLANETPSRRAYGQGYFLERETLIEDLRDYCGEAPDLHDPRLSPLLAKDLSGRPRALIHLAEYDPFRDEAKAYGRRLAQAGVAADVTCWPGMIHYFYCLPRVIACAGEALDTIGAEIAEALA